MGHVREPAESCRHRLARAGGRVCPCRVLDHRVLLRTHLRLGARRPAFSSGATVDRAGSATPAQFAAEHGDGPGFAVTGFGCDGKAFNLDAVRASGSTFDFEGVSLSTSVAAGSSR